MAGRCRGEASQWEPPVGAVLGGVGRRNRNVSPKRRARGRCARTLKEKRQGRPRRPRCWPGCGGPWVPVLDELAQFQSGQMRERRRVNEVATGPAGP